MREVLAATVIVLVASTTGAAAGPKVPKGLAGVELRAGATKVEIDKAVGHLGGRKVIGFRVRYRDEGGAGVELGILDAEARTYLLREEIDRKAKVSSEDLDGDGLPELVVSQGEVRRVWQVRYGAIAEIDPELAACPRSPEDDGQLGGDEATRIAQRRAAVTRFVEAVDMGERRAKVRCAYGDALAASSLAVTAAVMPTAETVIVSAPVARDCPAIAWVERQGLAFDPRRTFAFAAGGGVMVVSIVRGEILAARLETFVEHLHLMMQAARTSISWAEIWVLDEHLWLVAEVEISDSDGYSTRLALVYDPVADRLVARQPLAEYQTSRLEHRTSQHATFELVVEAGGTDEKIVWEKEAASWHM